MSDPGSLRQLFLKHSNNGKASVQNVTQVLKSHLGITNLEYLNQVVKIISHNNDYQIGEQEFSQLIYAYLQPDEPIQQLFYASDDDRLGELTKTQFELLCMQLNVVLSERALAELVRKFTKDSKFTALSWSRAWMFIQQQIQ
ncbi:hypothetical protein SS50377_22045 [Spironucleus salmonicida]|uniref:EF-hand domain-containing protein n=1 Tax=Spironucleus salmonicida TaxID=348837 RepID=V6LMD1_9EUKA|nr:hypothetical protein SS50377_22045 [Spironucleus salmonicida]|eukprot:EST45790.1 hypothetical protein SS50377_14364 [Spironucleus salmonicida]